MIKFKTVIAISLAVALGGFSGPYFGDRVMQRILDNQVATDGWEVNTGLGRYDGNWILRSVVARVGLGALVPEEALYYRTSVDSEGRPLSGEHQYFLIFGGQQLPPVYGFWSLTAYDMETLQLTDNLIDKYQIGDRSPDLMQTHGRAVVITFSQAEPIAGPENWLPTPSGDFDVVLRAYHPCDEMSSGEWVPPVLERLVLPEITDVEGVDEINESGTITTITGLLRASRSSWRPITERNSFRCDPMQRRAEQ